MSGTNRRNLPSRKALTSSLTCVGMRMNRLPCMAVDHVIWSISHYFFLPNDNQKLNP
uniref:AlNc14C3G379 protein n=1 Tax=Albugo laibachii Nc14 TaxID=890382 RepID=F0VZQ0_9STRA|nr:AlNc14C3G379 [Albugo laibachii Nc14]|eukprot:CCA14271.1 AlNc14C3G379 [Albugo laibachii Nc14]